MWKEGIICCFCQKPTDFQFHLVVRYQTIQIHQTEFASMKGKKAGKTTCSAFIMLTLVYNELLNKVNRIGIVLGKWAQFF